MKRLLREVTAPSSKIPSSSYIKILLKYFIANLSLRLNDMTIASQLSNEILNTDIVEYYGHMQSELTIEPMLIILNQKFNQFVT